MKVILLKQVQKVGLADQVVEVSEGYARNSLFPRKLAVPATAETLQALAKKKASVIAERAVRKTLLDKAIGELSGQRLSYPARANEQGNLFSKIDAKDIAAYLEKEHRIALDERCILLADGGIKKTGIYDIRVEDGDYRGSFSLEIVPR